MVGLLWWVLHLRQARVTSTSPRLHCSCLSIKLCMDAHVFNVSHSVTASAEGSMRNGNRMLLYVAGLHACTCLTKLNADNSSMCRWHLLDLLFKRLSPGKVPSSASMRTFQTPSTRILLLTC